MPQARIETGTNGRVEIHGELNFASVALLWNASRQCLPEGDALDIDLSHVERSDSAGLALVVDWIRTARTHGVPLAIDGVPAQMRNLAD